MNKKEGIYKLLKAIETGDPVSVSVVNEAQYIQHNPQTLEGSEGLAELFKRLSKTSPRVNIVRIFEDDNYVFAHTEYDFDTRNIGFEIFRFENDQAVEHWDNIQNRKRPNYSGHSMVDGVTEVTDHDSTEKNREIVKSFVKNILIESKFNNLNDYFTKDNYTEHNPNRGDSLTDLKHILSGSNYNSSPFIEYKKCHRLLAEGNFVLAVCEGYVNQKHSSIFELYRLKNEKIVEHWDTTEVIPPLDEWKNNNGKF